MVNRDVVERVAPPPSLGVVEYAPGPWRSTEAQADAAPGPPTLAAGGTGALDERVASFAAALARARRRLQLASDYFE